MKKMKTIFRFKLLAASCLVYIPAHAASDIEDVNSASRLITQPSPADVDQQPPILKRGVHANPFKLATVADDGRKGAAEQVLADNQQTDERAQRLRTRPDRPVNIAEVVVTAQKREERLQDVPLSIAVVTAEDIDRRAFASAEDYLRGIPGVNQTTDSGRGGSIIIRGMETQPTAQNLNQGSSVATYFGETATTNSGGINGNMNIDIRLVDIERVEVLRGPQGTTFGNSSLGGAVRTIPMAPRLDRFEGKLSAEYSVTGGTGGDNYNLQAVGNIPIIEDRFALRAVAYNYNESGIYRNVSGSNAAFQSAAAGWGAQQFAVDRDNIGDAEVSGARISALLQASDALKFSLIFLKQSNQNSTGSSSIGKFDFTSLQLTPAYAKDGNTDPYISQTIELANVVMEYGFSWADLLATYSYVKGDTTVGYVFSVLPALPWSLYSPTDSHANSGEIRLTTRFSGPLNFLAGVYTENVRDSELTTTIYSGIPSSSNPYGFLYETRYRTLIQKAAFGEVTWNLLPRLTLTGGFRSYKYDRDFNQVRDGALFGGFSVQDLHSEASGTTFRANISSKVTDDVLIYAAWSQGFRLGSPRAGVSPGICDQNNDGLLDDGSGISIASTRKVDPDSVDNYEVGGKATLLDRRLTIDATAFRMEWDGVPVSRQIQCNGGIFATYTTNAGKARSDGLELQTSFYPVPDLRVDLGGSWLRAELTRAVPAQGFRVGDRLPGSPKVNANLGLQYGFELGHLPASVRADAIYIGPFFGAVGEPAGSIPAGDYVRADLSARLSINATNIDLFVRNVTNEDKFTFRGAVNPGAVTPFSGFVMQPRTVGLRLSHSF